MQRNPEEPKGWRLVPQWLPVAVVIVTAFGNLGAVSATLASRMAEAEKRLDTAERARDTQRPEDEAFRAEIKSEIAAMRTDLQWIRRSLDRVPSLPRDGTREAGIVVDRAAR